LVGEVGPEGGREEGKTALQRPAYPQADLFFRHRDHNDHKLPSGARFSTRSIDLESTTCCCQEVPGFIEFSG
jgi:hypothetical protein